MTGAVWVLSDDDANSSSSLGPWDLVGLGGLVLGCLVAGLGVGWFVDAQLGSPPIFTLAGLAGGVIAGIVCSWLRIREFLRS